ncbi:alpha/beta fold hydrolase [Micromonospora echinospora]|uniref:alpha/beta fold hydrolase n=1 Tax=Micromonospora echinospora TaxID=1877 RepID=UPI0033C3F8EB
MDDESWTRDGIRVRGGGPAIGDGTGQPVLLLLHGLAANGAVWDGWRPVLRRHWPGRWLAPDLPGHGDSDPLDDYTFHTLAAGVARILDPGQRLVVLGHSLGGVLGLALAGAGFALPIEAVVGLGVKVAWSEEELTRFAALAQRPVAWFDSRAEATARYLRISGLDGLLDPTSPTVDAGLRSDGGRWRLALDPSVFAVGAPDMVGLLAGSRAEVTLARGERDHMVSREQLTRLVPAPVTLPGLGHNAHVEAPAAVFELLRPCLDGVGRP